MVHADTVKARKRKADVWTHDGFATSGLKSAGRNAAKSRGGVTGRIPSKSREYLAAAAYP